MAKQLSGAGLRGQVAGKTALSTVGKSGSGLTYRGYDVKDLAQNCQFEEVAYLILKVRASYLISLNLTHIKQNFGACAAFLQRLKKC